MPTPTYTPIANITLGSAASSVVFGSIPTTYFDLILIAETSLSANGSIYYSINGNTTNYEKTVLTGSGSAAAVSSTSTALAARTLNPTQITTSRVYIEGHFSAADESYKRHSSLIKLHDNALMTSLGVYQMTTNVSITSLTLSSNVNFQAGSTFALYGVIR